VELIDPSSADHAVVLAKILDLARWPHHCAVTRRATEDMVKARVTKTGVLEAIRDHILEQQPTYLLIQETTDLPAYVFLPCVIDSLPLYVKVQLSAAADEKDERLIIISAHPPKSIPRGVKK
jgi:hypothetical protein